MILHAEFKQRIIDILNSEPMIGTTNDEEIRHNIIEIEDYIMEIRREVI